MFPHDAIPDEFYEYVVRKLDDKAAQDPDLSRLVFDGVESLNRQTGSPWPGLSEQAKLQALKRGGADSFLSKATVRLRR